MSNILNKVVVLQSYSCFPLHSVRNLWPESIKLFIEGQAFSRVVRRLAHPFLPSHRHRRQLADERGGGRRGAESYDRKKAYSSNLIQYSFPICISPWLVLCRLYVYIHTAILLVGILAFLYCVLSYPCTGSYRTSIQETAHILIGMLPMNSTFCQFCSPITLDHSPCNFLI